MVVTPFVTLLKIMCLLFTFEIQKVQFFFYLLIYLLDKLVSLF